MIPSIAGACVSLLIFLAGRLAGNGFLFGLFISLPFGSTAIGAVAALGGSTPLIYTLFVGLLLLATVLKRGFRRDLGAVFRRHRIMGLTAILAVYATMSAIVFPRLFAGETMVFIPVDGVITELPLGPTSGNITQTAYFVLGILAFFAFRIALLQPGNFAVARRGFLTLISVHVALGLIDLGGKFAGLGDVLAPIRSANYALMTEDIAVGFFRISGGYSEASAYSATSLGCIAFTFTYWRLAGSKFALALTMILFALLLASTSTTAYVGLALLGLIAAIQMGAVFFSGRIKVEDTVLVVMATIILAVLMSAYVFDERLFDPAIDLFRIMVLEKAGSSSGIERSYWNYGSIVAFLETAGLGVGFGSSRSSSWLISTFAQLGVIGGLMVCALVAELFRGAGDVRATREQRDVYALASSARALGIGWLLSISLSGGAADPGLLFFLPLATVLGCRAYLKSAPQAERQTPLNQLYPWSSQ